MLNSLEHDESLFNGVGNFRLAEVPKEKRRWIVKVNGNVFSDVRSLELHGRDNHKPAFGTLGYGLWIRGGYDGWAFRELGRGGAVTVPYAREPHSRDIFVGLVREMRENMGTSPVLCAIGGFLDTGEKHRQTMERETAEEAGIAAMHAHELDGLPGNANRAFFVADAKNGEGIHAYGLELPFDQLEKTQRPGEYRLKNSAFIEGFSKKDDVRFFHWKDAVRQTADNIARAAIAQLLATIED